ncbi:MAG: FAD-binding oxidoreductase, partial [Lentihominibacter sp.]
MSLDREIYTRLEKIVGSRNISEDKGILESYRCIASQSSAHYGPYSHITPLPQAVILPGNTEEIRQIVLVCNEYRIQFKASTTFWSVMGYIGSDMAIQMDLRRMRSIEIDEENQIAIVEPYAIAGAIQAEAMKHGLNLNIPGVGCSSSTVASTAGWVGAGPSTAFMGVSGENMLGAEWVLPDGTVLKTGSLGSGAGWFCGEGPGPSARAILRGNLGTCGAMGVCTKLAVRLHPWPGPEVLPSRGKAPAYKAELGDNFKCYTLCFGNWEDWTRAVELLQENDIVYLGHRQFNMFGRDLKMAMIKIVTDPDKQLCDLPELVNDPELVRENESMKIEIQVVLAGMSK